MLAVSVSAAEGIRGMLSAMNPPEETGVRLALGESDGALDDFELVVGDRLPDSDETLREHGVELHLDKQAVPELDDKLLDAHVERGVLRFRLVPQSG